MQQRVVARAGKRAIVAGPPVYFRHDQLKRETDFRQLRG